MAERQANIRSRTSGKRTPSDVAYAAEHRKEQLPKKETGPLEPVRILI